MPLASIDHAEGRPVMVGGRAPGVIGARARAFAAIAGSVADLARLPRV